MTDLLKAIKSTINEECELPFAVYCSIKEQLLLNVPIAKPLLVVVLNGEKELNNDLVCHSGEFIFLSDTPSINMCNIPKDKKYFALIIEFDYQDFSGLQIDGSHEKDFLIGKTAPSLEKCLQQFVETSLWAPKQVWSLRKREIILLLCHIGYKDILCLLGRPQIKDKLHEIFTEQKFTEVTVDLICKQLAMSESTLRRKLKSDGTSVGAIKDQARLGLGLHLLQTTRYSIGMIADKCGYQSQSRFTDRFKQRFGLTPTALRKTQMTV
ncbi:MAG: helix-turn-helix transcriptional regulator [Alteromonadales bacterium]|nr:helix-turn-helix transcriptional regulator [Alteromonadales bacterium]